MLDELDLEDDYNFLHGYHKWVMIRKVFEGAKSVSSTSVATAGAAS